MELRTFRIAGLALALMTAGEALAAQAETFDIATFVRPAGWTRSDTNGNVVLGNDRMLQTGPVSCRIFMFPSRPSSAPAAVEFETEWRLLVGQRVGAFQHEPAEVDTSTPGWTATDAIAGVESQGTRIKVLLVTLTGFGRLMSIMVLSPPTGYDAEISGFFKGLDLHVNERPQIAAGEAGGLNRYVYTPPPGWGRQNAQDGIVLAVQPGGEQCQIQMLPLQRASGALVDEAVATYRRAFNEDPLQRYPHPARTLARGISPQGWEYFEIKKIAGGQEGDGKGIGTILLLAKLDDVVATIIGVSGRDFMVSQCFGELRGSVWPAFFYSLSFTGLRAGSAAGSALREHLVGNWISATANIGLGYTFRADGRYGTNDRAHYVTTEKYSGNGTYSFEGNTLVLSGDGGRRSVEHIRLDQVTHTSGQTWEDQLCMMEGSGEICYRRGL